MEELKMVMESISTLGGDAKVAFITWLVVRYVIQGIIIGGTIVGIGMVVSKLTVNIINTVTFTARLCEEGGHRWLSPGAKSDIINSIRKGKETVA